MKDWINTVYLGDCLEVMKGIPDNFIDLTVTSPPYDNLRTYNDSLKWDFEIFQGIAKELYRITKQGGVVVWVVGDATINGSETGTSFKQALYFKEIGFNLHDTMIYSKNNCPFPSNVRYNQQFEYMFVLSKGNNKTFNPLKELKSEKELIKIKKGTVDFASKSFRDKNGLTIRADTNEKMLDRITKSGQNEYKTKSNLWAYPSGYMVSSKDKIAFEHPATFPEKLAEDHILSWSNENDIILDPFAGSGTTLKMAIKNNRNYIGIEKEPKYYDIILQRIGKEKEQTKLEL